MSDFSDSRPRVGQMITYRGERGTVRGEVASVDGNLCWVRYEGKDAQPFIWRFRDGLNTLHDWPTKARSHHNQEGCGR